MFARSAVLTKAVGAIVRSIGDSVLTFRVFDAIVTVIVRIRRASR